MTTIGRLRELREQGFTLDEALTHSASDPLRDRIKELNLLLLEYGSCTPKCSKWWSHSSKPMEHVECDCGWDKVKESVE